MCVFVCFCCFYFDTYAFFIYIQNFERWHSINALGGKDKTMKAKKKKTRKKQPKAWSAPLNRSQPPGIWPSPFKYAFPTDISAFITMIALMHTYEYKYNYIFTSSIDSSCALHTRNYVFLPFDSSFMCLSIIIVVCFVPNCFHLHVFVIVIIVVGAFFVLLLFAIWLNFCALVFA